MFNLNGFYKMLGIVLGIIAAIVGLIILFLHLLPQAATQASGLSGNLTAAGVSTEGAQWYVWLFWGLLTIMVVVGGIKMFKDAMGKG